MFARVLQEEARMKSIKWGISYLNGECKEEHTPAQILEFSAVTLELSHVVILLMFLYVKIYFMVAVNVVSLILYIGCFFVAKKGTYRMFYSIVYIEVCAHVILATIMIGDRAGFTMHWIAILSILYMCCYGFRTVSPAKGTFHPFVFDFTSFALFLALKVYCYYRPPLHPLTASAYRMFYLVNYTITLFAVILSLSIFITQAMQLRAKLLEKNALLERMSTTDTLTGLSTRRIVSDFFEMSAQNDIPFCAILGDIDDFKKVNDTYGHEYGDKVLVMVSDAFRSSVRKTDIVCRWGGEEILVILPQCDLSNAKRVAEKIRETVGGGAVPYGDGEIRVTMTLGIAASSEAVNMEKVVSAADANLYYGKRHGKNRVVTTEDAAPAQGQGAGA